MADNDQSLYNLRYNQITQGMEGFGGGTPQWTPLVLSGGGGTPGGVNGDVQFNSSGSFGGDANLFWDNTNKRLGVGTNAPTTTFNVSGNALIIPADSGGLEVRDSGSNVGITLDPIDGMLDVTSFVNNWGITLGAILNQTFNGLDVEASSGGVGSAIILRENSIVDSGWGIFRPAVGLGGGSGSLLFQTSNNVFTAMAFAPAGNVGIATATPNSSAALDVTSTTQGLLPPRMTTTQKDAISSPAEGLVVYDLTLHKLSVFTGSIWETVTSS